MSKLYYLGRASDEDDGLASRIHLGPGDEFEEGAGRGVGAGGLSAAALGRM